MKSNCNQISHELLSRVSFTHWRVSSNSCVCVCVCVLTYLLENSLRKSCFFCSDRLNFFSVSVNFIAHSLLVEKQRCFNVPKLRHLFAAWISVWQVKQSRDERPFLQHVIPNLDGDLFRACLRARGFRLNGTALCERAELLLSLIHI